MIFFLVVDSNDKKYYSALLKVVFQINDPNVVLDFGTKSFFAGCKFPFYLYRDASLQVFIFVLARIRVNIDKSVPNRLFITKRYMGDKAIC